ncbi:MAG: TVP38/TMEM64 family protein, partial [Marinobacter sp.]|nr:TVP38/TMEM64 family protein [Marinobacter sp.]
MNWKKLTILCVILALVGAFIALGGNELLTLDNLQRHQAELDQWIASHLTRALLGFVLIYIVVTALSLPGATILTLAAGAFFGNLNGLLAASVASTIGATLAFLAARFLFRDTLRARYADTVARMDEGIRKDGAFYLATLRLVPVFPFFLINIAMGLTGMRVRTYSLVSWVAMMPGTFVYVNAGTQLAQIQSLGDVVSPSVLLSFVLLGVFPLIAKAVIGVIRRR